MGQPVAQVAVLWNVVMGQQGVGPGLADQGGLAVLAVAQQLHGAMLVRVELADAVFVEEAAGHPAEFVGAEPGLGFEPEGVEGAVVAGEESRGVMVVHDWPSNIRRAVSDGNGSPLRERFLGATIE